MDMHISIIGGANIRIIHDVEKAMINNVSFEYATIIAPLHRDWTLDAPYGMDQRNKVYNIGKH